MDKELLHQIVGYILLALFIAWCAGWWPFNDKEKEDDVPERDTSDVYDSADGNELLQAKVRCLELAIKNYCGMHVSAKVIVDDAKKFWDFVAYEPEVKDE